MKILYGYDAKDANGEEGGSGDSDEFVRIAEETMDVFGEITKAGKWMVDFIPQRKGPDERLFYPRFAEPFLLWSFSRLPSEMVPWCWFPPSG